MLKLSKTPMDILSSDLPFKCLEGLLYAPTNIMALEGCNVKQLQLILFEEHPGNRNCPLEQALNQIIRTPYESGIYWELQNRSNCVTTL